MVKGSREEEVVTMNINNYFEEFYSKRKETNMVVTEE